MRLLMFARKIEGNGVKLPLELPRKLSTGAVPVLLLEYVGAGARALSLNGGPTALSPLTSEQGLHSH